MDARTPKSRRLEGPRAQRAELLRAENVLPLPSPIRDAGLQDIVTRIGVRVREQGHPDPQEQVLMEMKTQHGVERPLPAIEAARALVGSHTLDPQALLENNVVRHGGWATEPDRQRQEWRVTSEDIIGSLQVDYSAGQLSVFDLQLLAWVKGRWKEGTSKVVFSLRECARDFGVSYGGSQAEQIKKGLRRIRRTHFVARVWDASTKKHVEKDFGLIDELVIAEKRNSFDGPALEPGTIEVTLSDFMISQLEARQFVRLSWDIFRRRISSPLGKRLYALVESQEGWAHGETARIWEITIDSKLSNSLGSEDRNRDRFRAKLRRAGQEIMQADSRYTDVSIRQGKARGAHILRVVRQAS